MSNPEHLFRIVAFVPEISSSNNTGLGAILLSCLFSELKDTRTQTQDTFPSFELSLLLLVSRNKYAKFGANWFNHS
jgi:hypothetical protein